LTFFLYFTASIIHVFMPICENCYKVSPRQGLVKVTTAQFCILFLIFKCQFLSNSVTCDNEVITESVI